MATRPGVSRFDADIFRGLTRPRPCGLPRRTRARGIRRRRRGGGGSCRSSWCRGLRTRLRALPPAWLGRPVAGGLRLRPERIVRRGAERVSRSGPRNDDGRATTSGASSCGDRSILIRAGRGQVRLDGEVLEAIGPAAPDDPAGAVQALRGRSRVGRLPMAHRPSDVRRCSFLRRESGRGLDELALASRGPVEDALHMRLGLRRGLAPPLLTCSAVMMLSVPAYQAPSPASWKRNGSPHARSTMERCASASIPEFSQEQAAVLSGDTPENPEETSVILLRYF